MSNVILSFSTAELLLCDLVANATRANLHEWNFRYSHSSMKRESADELHWEASMRYYFAAKHQNEIIIFRESNKGVDLTKRDCELLTGVSFTAELRYTYRLPTGCWDVFEKKRIRFDTKLYLILLPNDGSWDQRKQQQFPELTKKVGHCLVNVKNLSNHVSLAMVKLK